MYMNAILLVGIFGGFAAIGIIVYVYQRERKRFFESLAAFCKHLSSEISFSKNQIGVVITHYQSSYPSRQFQQLLTQYKDILDARLDITRESLDALMWQRLKPEEAAQVSNFFLDLGRFGVREEIEKLDGAHELFNSHHESALARLKKESILWLKLAIITGIASVIMLM